MTFLFFLYRRQKAAIMLSFSAHPAAAGIQAVPLLAVIRPPLHLIFPNTDGPWCHKKDAGG
jgi:hypothetical protein